MKSSNGTFEATNSKRVDWIDTEIESNGMQLGTVYNGKLQLITSYMDEFDFTPHQLRELADFIEELQKQQANSHLSP